MRNDRLFEGENGFEYWTHKGLYSSVTYADGKNNNHATLGSDDNINMMNIFDDDSSSDSSSDEEDMDSFDRKKFSDTLVSNLNDEKNEIKVDLYGNRVRKDGDGIHRYHHDHNRGHGNHVREDSMKWTKMQHNMEDQEFRLNQLQNHINAVEITISGLMKMSRETLEINKELVHHHSNHSPVGGNYYNESSNLLSNNNSGNTASRRRKGGIMNSNNLPMQ